MLTKLVDKVGAAPGTITVGFDGQNYYPYATPADMKDSGLGIIDPHDWWHTGRPYGLPGTAAVYFPKKGSPEVAGADLGTLWDSEQLWLVYALFAAGGFALGYFLGRR